MNETLPLDAPVPLAQLTGYKFRIPQFLCFDLPEPFQSKKDFSLEREIISLFT